MGPQVGAAGAPGAQAPAGGADAAFKDSIKDKPDWALRDMLKNGGLTGAQKMAVIELLAKRKSEESGGADGIHGGGGDDDEDIMELLKELMNGTISPEKLQKLARMLGVDPKDLENGGKTKGADADANDPNAIK